MYISEIKEFHIAIYRYMVKGFYDQVESNKYALAVELSAFSIILIFDRYFIKIANICQIQLIRYANFERK
jgi:hypothetical protein